jgi:hypothetical protein
MIFVIAICIIVIGMMLLHPAIRKVLSTNVESLTKIPHIRSIITKFDSWEDAGDSQNKTTKIFTVPKSPSEFSSTYLKSLKFWVPDTNTVSHNNKKIANINIFKVDELREEHKNLPTVVLHLYTVEDGKYISLLSKPIEISSNIAPVEMHDYSAFLKPHCFLNDDSVVILQREYLNCEDVEWANFVTVDCVNKYI